jgi:[ribosomal protein S18]-alanine N-acetyltransferase
MAVRSEPRVLIQGATRESLDGVLRIEHASFPTPWSADAFVAELCHPQSCFRVATVDPVSLGEPAGYIVSWLVADEVHVLKLAVDPPYRRRGVGTALLRDSLGSLAARGATMAYLEVRKSNAGALAFYHEAGFDPIGRRPKYYADTGEDALVLCKALP